VTRIWLFFVIAMGCSGHHVEDRPVVAPLSVVDDGGRTVVVLTPDNQVLDRSGKPVGRVEWSTAEVTIDDIRQPVTFEVESGGIAVTTMMGTWHVVVQNANELQVNGKHAGKLVAFAPTKDGWRRLAAVVVAIPMLPVTPPDNAVDAAVPTIEPPPPLPPPPPPQQHG
jgi:hypothetical protein